MVADNNDTDSEWKMSVCENIITHPLPFSREEDPVERPMAKALNRAAERLVDSLKINSVSEKAPRGGRLIIKRRNGYSEPLAKLTICTFGWRVYRFGFG